MINIKINKVPYEEDKTEHVRNIGLECPYHDLFNHLDLNKAYHAKWPYPKYQPKEIQPFSLDQVEELLKGLNEYNIEALSLKKIDEFYAQCVQFLDPHPNSVYKQSLVDLLGFIRNRDY